MSTLKRESEMKLTSILIILLFAFTLAACGGGGGSSRTPEVVMPMTYPVDLGGSMLADGTQAGEHMIPADGSMDIGDITFTCPAGNACTLTINADGTATSTGGMVTAMAMMPEPPEPSVDLMGLNVPANDYMIAAGKTMNVGAGETEVTLSCSAAAACAFTVAAGGMVTPTTGEVTAALSAAAKKAIADREEAERLAMEKEERMRMEAEQARIMALTMAIADPDGDGKPSEENEQLESSKRPGADAMITFGAKGVATVTEDEMLDRLGVNDTKIHDDREFDKVTRDRLSLSGGFKPSVYERSMDGKTDTLTVYSDVKPAGSQSFNDHHPSGYTDANGDGDGVDEITAPTSTETTHRTRTYYNTITFSVTEDITADGTRKVTGSKFPSAPSDEDADGVKSYTEDLEFSGSYQGIPGTFTCTGDCTFSHSVSKGLRVAVGDELKFRPRFTVDDNEDEHMIAGVVGDSDYLSFGYWVQSMPMGSGMKYGVNVFFGGNNEFGVDAADGNASITRLVGKATYDGSATGLYARKELTVNDGRAVVGTPVAAGQFAADVSLTAYFNNTADTSVSTTGLDLDKIPDNQTFSISGTVDNFTDGDGAIDPSWSVDLMQAHYDADKGTNYSREFAGDTGSGDLSGEWKGAFFGSVMVPAAEDLPEGVNADTYGATLYPSGVAGEFTGHFTNGHVIGAFGATQ